MSLTPITEIHPAVCNLAAIVPEYAQPEKIGVHLRNLGRVAGWGGFYHDQVTIVGRAGATSSYSPSVVGHDGQGHAMMGAVEAKTADLGTGTAGASNADWRSRTSLTLQINTAELTQRVQDSGPSRDPANWATHINSALALGLRDATWRHLVGRPLPKAETILTVSAMCGASITHIAAAPEIMSVVMSAGWAGLFLPNIYRFIFTKGVLKRPLREAYFSLVPVMHFDRLAMVSGLSRAYRLAGTIEPKDQS